jgi:hypothetical protein
MLVVVLVVIVLTGVVGAVSFRQYLTFGGDTGSAVSPKICAQVITAAKNPQTQACKTFPTPCDVPTGWNIVPSCEAVTPTPSVVDTSNWKLYSGNGGGFSFKYPSDWRYYIKNTSWKIFGELHFMNILEFDKIDSAKKDPQGLLLGRIELTYFNGANFGEKTVDDYIADVFKYGKPESKDATIGDVKVKLVHHINCSWGSDCIDVVYKQGSEFFDWRLLVKESKEEDLQLLYAIIKTFSFKAVN